MKVFAFIFVAISMVVEITSSESEEIKGLFEKWVDACATELEVPQEKLVEYQSMSEIPAERLAFCFSACMYEKAGLMKDGKLIDDVISAAYDYIEGNEEMEKLKKVGEACQKKILASGETNKCDIAAVFTNCVYHDMHTDACLNCTATEN